MINRDFYDIPTYAAILICRKTIFIYITAALVLNLMCVDVIWRRLRESQRRVRLLEREHDERHQRLKAEVFTILSRICVAILYYYCCQTVALHNYSGDQQ
jgi:hypothetical protein